jgi:RNA polymerase sigma-70 factor (ECF subfamily)
VGGRTIGDDRATDAFAAALDRDEVREALRQLPESHRRVLTLRFYDDLELDQICSLLGCSRSTFAVKLHRALRALRGALAMESIDVA